jgi:hypothetical protein
VNDNWLSLTDSTIPDTVLAVIWVQGRTDARAHRIADAFGAMPFPLSLVAAPIAELIYRLSRHLVDRAPVEGTIAYNLRKVLAGDRFLEAAVTRNQFVLLTSVRPPRIAIAMPVTDLHDIVPIGKKGVRFCFADDSELELEHMRSRRTLDKLVTAFKGVTSS